MYCAKGTEWTRSTDICFYCRKNIPRNDHRILWDGMARRRPVIITFHIQCANAFVTSLVPDIPETDLEDKIIERPAVRRALASHAWSRLQRAPPHPRTEELNAQQFIQNQLAQQFIWDQLATGPKSPTDIYVEGRAQTFTENQLHCAAKKLGVIQYEDNRLWELPASKIAKQQKLHEDQPANTIQPRKEPSIVFIELTNVLDEIMPEGAWKVGNPHDQKFLRAILNTIIDEQLVPESQWDSLSDEAHQWINYAVAVQKDQFLTEP